MKKACILIFLFVIAFSTVFASETLNLSYVEESFQILEVYYDGEQLDISKNTEKTLTADQFALGQSAPIKVRWNGNVGIAPEMVTISFYTETGFVNEDANDSTKVYMVPEGELTRSITDSTGKEVGSVILSSMEHVGAGLSYQSSDLVRGSFDLATFYVTWDKDYPWVAGQYKCDIRMVITGV